MTVIFTAFTANSLVWFLLTFLNTTHSSLSDLLGFPKF
ncbi:hypothetical protein CWATWH0401_1235 [Crocosphaera watsonii WH 0401]|uniref:Uncharacterized protein n=1 Tax=Crocosphaera watsonii WH 0401 TaxID=555881 RepID=T2JCB9_CROWT|nr:hypothetical protein CWATWH0401_1235 [Crocosphaera watsonii WH 0401]